MRGRGMGSPGNIDAGGSGEPLKGPQGRLSDSYFLDKMKDNWKINPASNYLDNFLSKYAEHDARLKGIDTAAGLGRWSPGGAGQGMYDSQLMGDLTGRATSDLANPGTGIGENVWGQIWQKAREGINSGYGAQRQGITSRFAGTGRRGSGLLSEMLRRTDESQVGAEQNTARDQAIQRAMMEVQARQQAFQNASGLEGMKGGFYENSKGRELSNAGLDLQGFEGSKDRELRNSALGLDIYSRGSGNLGSLADMLKWQGGNEINAQQQSFTNLGAGNAAARGRAGEENALADSNFEKMKPWLNWSKASSALPNRPMPIRNRGVSNPYSGGGRRV